MLTNFLSLFKVVRRTSTVITEKILMIYIGVVRESYDRRRIEEIGWIMTGDTLANAFTNLKPCPGLE